MTRPRHIPVSYTHLDVYKRQVQVQVSDAFTTISRDVVVNSIQFIMDFKSGGKGIAFGKVAEYDDLLDVGWDAHFRGDAQVDGDIYQNNTKLIDIGSNSNGTYIQFSDGTMICTKPVSYTHLDVYKRQAESAR